MASVSDFVSLTISSTSLTASRPGFGTPLIMTYHTRFTDKVRTYSSIAGMEADGFVAADPAHRMATACFAQNPRPQRVKVGRLLTAHQQILQATVQTAVVGDVYTMDVQAPGSTSRTTISYTVPAGSPTTTTIANAIAGLINAVSGITATNVGAIIDVRPSSNGDVVYWDNIRVEGSRTNAPLFADITAASTYVNDLGELALVDNDWYFLGLDINSHSVVDAVSAWMSTRKQLYLFANSDGVELTTSTLFNGLRTTSRRRTFAMWAEDLSQYPALALAGSVAPKDPGSITWKFQQLTGVTPVDLTTSEETELVSENANWYTEVASIPITLNGVMPSSEFADIIRGTDWTEANIQADVFQLLANADKIPFTDAGADQISATILGVLQTGVDRGLFEAGTPAVTATPVANISVTDRANRNFSGFEFSARFAGAAHTVTLTGTLVV